MSCCAEKYCNIISSLDSDRVFPMCGISELPVPVLVLPVVNCRTSAESSTVDGRTENEVSMNEFPNGTARINHEEIGPVGAIDLSRADSNGPDELGINNTEGGHELNSPSIRANRDVLLAANDQIYGTRDLSISEGAKDALNVENVYTTVQKKKGKKKRGA